MPTFLTQQNIGVLVQVDALPSVANAPDILAYTAGGGSLFPDLKNDLVLEPGIYHGGNPIVSNVYNVKSCSNVTVEVETKEVLSPENSKGLFDIEAAGMNPGQVDYYWNKTYTTPLGIYTVRNEAIDFDMVVEREILQIQVNDVNIMPRVGDYVVFNEIPLLSSGYVNGNLASRLKLYKGTELFQAKVLEVIILGGAGKDITYQLRLDKSFSLTNGDRYGMVLLNRLNTGIQKELFYDTFEQIEVHRQQLLGDPYNNSSNVNKPKGRKNHLNYKGHEALGYRNLLRNIINEKETPFIIFDINDEVKDRFSTGTNVYDSSNGPSNIHFEMHLPGVLINENVFPSSNNNTSTVDANGNVIENIFVASTNIMNETNGVGKYAGLYLKWDKNFTNRFGYIFFDLRIVVIDHEELATALGYNSNRNYTLPRPTFKIGSGNSLINPGNGTNLDIVDATNDSLIIIRTATPHKLQRGTKVMIKDVQGNTNANGEYFVDLLYPSPDPYRFELWEQLPQYNPDGTRVQPNGGIAVSGNGVFVNNGVGNSGKVIGALPNYSYFYTYRVRNKQHEQTMPFAEIINFNFTKGGSIDNSQGSLFVNIPKFNWARGQGNLGTNLGFNIINDVVEGYGFEIIIGEYDRDVNDPVSPNKITGIKNIMCIPASELDEQMLGDPFSGVTLEVKKVQDYMRAISDTANNIKNYSFDLYSNQQLYTYNVNELQPTMLTGQGLWTIGEIIYRNQVEMYMSKISVHVPADKWNDSINPSFRPSVNDFIKDKYISEVALILSDDDGSNHPVIYTKISPAVRKNNLLDLTINLNVHF